MDEQVKRFNQASRGIVKTNAQRADEAAHAKRMEGKYVGPVAYMPHWPFDKNSLMQVSNPIPGITDDDEYPKSVPFNPEFRKVALKHIDQKTGAFLPPWEA